MPSASLATPSSAGSTALPRRSADRGCVRHVSMLDIGAVAALALLTAAILLPAFTRLPMLLWDESRNANNAVEMAMGGNWLVTLFNGVPDHWNTKPPLLIWAAAALLRSGMPPLAAVRLPAALAGLGTALLVFAYPRFCLGDRLAGVVAALLLLGSRLFMGPHVALTGDFDAPLSFFLLLHVIALDRLLASTGQRRAWWLALCAAALTGAVMTKSIAGLLAEPGLLVLVVARGQLPDLLRDTRIWIAGLAVVAIVATYYLARGSVDPGYLGAVWHNDLGGRYLKNFVADRRGPLFYEGVLLFGFPTGVILLPLLALTWRRQQPAQRHMVLACLGAAASILAVISSAATQLTWYAAPIVPMLALAAGIAAAEATRSSVLSSRTIRPRLLVLTVAIPAVASIYASNIMMINSFANPTMAQSRYGQFLSGPVSGRPIHSLIFVDHGVRNDAGFRHYNPIADFYGKVAAWHGERIRVMAPPVAPGTDDWLLSCDPQVRARWRNDPSFKVSRSNRWCTLGRLAHFRAG